MHSLFCGKSLELKVHLACTVYTVPTWRRKVHGNRRITGETTGCVMNGEVSQRPIYTTPRLLDENYFDRMFLLFFLSSFLHRSS